MRTCFTHSLAPPPGRRPVLRRWWTRLAGLVLACALPLVGHAQLVATYTFAKSTATFTPLTGATPTPVLLADEGVTTALPLPFTFRFDGVDYTSVYATSNGCLSFNSNAGGDYGNDLTNAHTSNDPLIAGLWDDLGGTVPGSVASYVVTGSTPNRVFTFEWLNWGWNFAAASASVSFQIKLHEGTNQVEMVYRPEAGATNNPSASVGLRSAAGVGAGSFLSVSSLDNSAVASNATATDNLTAQPTAGLDFTFTPTACAVPPTYATLPLSQSFETAWTDACGNHNAAGSSWRTTPVIGNDSWRRDDDGASAAWTSPAGYLPTPVASQGSHAAIFHSAYAPSGSTGSLDLYANLSVTGTKVLTFDYVNVDNTGSSSPEKLDVLVSTDGGQTFGAALLTLTLAPTYTAQSVVIPSTSATTVIRFQGTGDYGYSDIGIDNVQLTASACVPPTGVAVSSITSTSASFTFANSASATNYTVTYQAQGGPVQTVSPSPTGTPVALTGLTPATSYTVSAVSNCGGSTTSAPTNTLTFITAPINDLCANATGLTPAATCTGTVGTMAGAQANALLDSHLDVWYSFVASGPELHVTVAGTASTNLVTQVYGSACPTNTNQAIASNSSSHDTFLTGLTGGQTYRVRIYDYYDAAFTPATGGFTICVTSPPLPTPANDLCTSPQSITPASPCNGIAGTVGGATANPLLDTNDDVWYSFVASSTQHNITLNGPNLNNLVTQVYNNTCPSNSSQALVSNSSSSNTFVTGLTVGTTYLVRVYNYYSAAGFLTPAAGAFTICIDHPSNAPANDECAGAIGLGAVTSTCISTSGTLFGATQSTVIGSSVGTPDDDVWYSFVASGPQAGVYLTNTGGLDMVVNLRTGPCGTGTSLRSGDQAGATPGTLDSVSVHNLTFGQTYYVRVYSYYNVPSTATNGTFTLCVTTPGTCAPPTALTTSNLTNTSAELDWTAGSAGIQYRVEYGPTGFTPGTGTVAITNNNFVTATGLTAATTYQFYVTQTCGSGLSSVRVGPQSFTTTGLNNLIVTNGQTLTNVQGTYDNVTVQTGGSATLAGGLVVNQTITVQSGGILNTNCQLITGAASFTLSAGGTLGICNVQGIYQTGASGTVQVTGARSFSADGLYVYNGTAPQSSGPGLPTTVRELTVNNGGNGLTLNNTGLDIARVLRLTSGNFLTNTLPVRLLSSSAGTALVDNTGGAVTGTVQVQRYVSSTLNVGMGYRHFSAAVASPPVSQLGSSGSPIVVNSAFNGATALVRPTIVPYPTVFYYNESNVPAGGNTTTDFDQGFFSPATASDPMNPLQGFTTQVAGGQTVTLSGTLNNGAQTKTSLAYTNASTQAGWQLLGNPYPSPLDWSTLTVGTTAANNLQNLNGALYVFQSSGQYAGTYRSYIGGIGDPLVASGQGFFVRTAGQGQTGTLRLSNANRVTTWTATNSTLYRTTSDLRPQAHLSLSSLATGISPDETTVYFEAGATAATDAAYDAYKLHNPGAAVSLFSLAGADELSINGLPVLSQALQIPLGLSVPQAGQYTFNADQFLNLGATTVYLSDALTGTLVNLSQQPVYSFQVAASSLSSKTRFVLQFRPANVTATRNGLDASLVSLYPNPARQEFTLTLPALPTAKTVQARLVNALGQVMLTRTLTPSATGLTERFDVRGLATGVYSLLLTAGSEVPLTKRLVIE